MATEIAPYAEAGVASASGLICPLCAGVETRLFYQDTVGKRRRRARLPRNKVMRAYHLCRGCGLVFVPQAFLLDPKVEKHVYDQHQNSLADPGYCRFLAQLYEPMCARLPAPARGLDFGSGPEPVLAMLLRERGYQIHIYDPYYAPARGVLEQSYDFVTCSEVIEHIYTPAESLDKLWGSIMPGGLLGIMTSMVPEAAAFATWRYKDDPTHVRFYAKRTFEWLAHKWNSSVEFVDCGVVIFTKV
ncbi:MAG: class I SAM-dependent methyltransferase [Desulfuromonadaceae bacterium]|nr:class I SAM-dependent methyltransferase [Desulfuromonas sp.]MDY0184350.1 class I SAM-dependent methyltransferase [Desulfuromonadaceae bacterium]